MSKSHGILAVLLLILITAVIVFKVRVPYGEKNSSFSIDWVDDVRSITISYKDQTLVLDKKGEEWMVNNLFVARKSAVDFIIKTIGSVEIKSPVSADLYKDLVADHKIEPHRIEINGRKKSTTFLIYKSSDLLYGSIFKRNHKSKPFFVSLPAYDIDPGNNFVTDEKFWMPYHIFNIDPDIIESVELIYKDSDMDDVTIIKGEEKYSLFINGSPSSEVKQDKIRRYITYFTFVPFENWAFGIDSVSSSRLTNSEPEIIIKVGLSDGNKIVASFWTRLINSKQDQVPDTDRLYGALNDGRDVFIARYFDIDPLIKSADYFISD